MSLYHWYSQTKQTVIATQLAQEWIEMVYQIRNTNLLKYSFARNNARLKINPYEFLWEWSDEERIHTESYVLSWKILIKVDDPLNIGDWIDDYDKEFNLCLTWWQRISCPWLDNQTNYGKFFRTIEWKWLYTKFSSSTWWELITCQEAWWFWSICHDKTAKEFRFCSRVEYIWTKTWNIEICGVLTNFFD